MTALLARSRADSAAGLTAICRQIAEGLDLPRVALQLTDAVAAHPVAGAEVATGADLTGAVGVFGRRGLRRFPILLAGEQVGVLTMDVAALRRLGAAQLRLLDDVIDVLGPVLELGRTERELEAARQSARAHAERIAAGRKQAFAERDQERRDLERDLHDGAQHHLVALRMTLGLLDLQLAGGDPAVVRNGLARLRAGIDQTEQTLLGTAAGSCPPILLERGLVAALTADLADTPQRVRVLAALAGGGARRFPPAIETAVYFTCLEAVNNAGKHAPGAEVVVRLSAGPQDLTFAVIDDGPGLDQQDPVDSFGLGNMRTRIEAAGGTLRLHTAPGAGTSIEGVIPL